MKPDGLCSRRRKFPKIVIFVWWPSVTPPDHMGARTPKKCTPTIQKNSVARPFLWNVGEWWECGTENGCTRAGSAYFFSNGYSVHLWFMTRIFVSWHMLSKWNLMVCVFALQNSKKSSFLSGDPPMQPPDHMGARTPKKCTPTIQKTLLPDHFCERLGSDGCRGLKMAVLKLGVHTFFQMVIPAVY